MNRTYPVLQQESLDTITRLLDENVDKLMLIMRHSERHFHSDASMEPFMGLTDTGKDLALSMGESLPMKPFPQFFSSFFGRCIETAGIIDKGYSKAHHRFNGHTELVRELAPFYITDIRKAVDRVTQTGSEAFIRDWFEHKIPESVIQDPSQAADEITGFLKSRLDRLSSDEMGIAVSHDWNLFPVKEFKLGLDHETFGNVGYLESIILFEKNGKPYITNYQKEPIPLKS